MQQIKKTLRIFLQVGGICLFFQGMGWLVQWLNLPIPANVLGLIVMVLLLWSGAIPLKVIEDGSEILLKYMPILFVPFGVAMMNYGGLFKDAGAILFPVLILTSVLVPAVTGYSAVFWQKWQDKKKGIDIHANVS